MRSIASEGVYVCEFIEAHCRITRGAHAGELVRLLSWERELIGDLFVLQHGRRRYRRAYVQLGRKNGKTFLTACVAL
jgi:phage terminase large subunit-like protein